MSFYNEGTTGPIPPTPTILAVGLVDDISKAVTSDLKEGGSVLFLVGNNGQDMGGSLFLRVMGKEDSRVPRVEISQVKEYVERMLAAMDKGLIAACHDPSEGGLAATLAEMCIGGGLGVRVEVETSIPTSIWLFNESPTRWIVEVPADKVKEFKSHMGELVVEEMGIVGGEALVITVNGKKYISAPVSQLHGAWENPLWEEMG